MILWLLRLCSLHEHAYLIGMEAMLLPGVIVRAALSALLSMLLGFLYGCRIIGWLSTRFRERNISNSAKLAQLHRHKHAASTMGGLFIMLGIAISTFVLGDLQNRLVLVTLLSAVARAALGSIDDLKKLRIGRRGMTARWKFFWQCCIAITASVLVYYENANSGANIAPLLPSSSVKLGLGLWTVPPSLLVIVGLSNAVILTGGFNGVAGGCLLPAIFAMSAIVLHAPVTCELLAVSSAMFVQ